jgi:hypothetical protein
VVNKIRGLFVTLAQVLKYASKTGQILASNETIENRMAVCRSCGFLMGSRCEHCGCNMPIKVGLFAAVCPIGKWDIQI